MDVAVPADEEEEACVREQLEDGDVLDGRYFPADTVCLCSEIILPDSSPASWEGHQGKDDGYPSFTEYLNHCVEEKIRNGRNSRRC